MPSELRAKLGVSTSPLLFFHFEGVRMVTPQTVKPSPGVVQSLMLYEGYDPILTWNLGELCSVIRYRSAPVVLVEVLIRVGFPILPSIWRSA